MTLPSLAVGPHQIPCLLQVLLLYMWAGRQQGLLQRVFPGTAPSLLFMYLQWVCPNNAPDLQRATIVYGPPVILHVTLYSQLDVTELMSGQIITCVPEVSQRMLLCTVVLQTERQALHQLR